MHWIEQMLGVDPDGGSGLLEILIAVAFGLSVGGGVMVRRLHPKSSRRM